MEITYICVGVGVGVGLTTHVDCVCCRIPNPYEIKIPKIVFAIRDNHIYPFSIVSYCSLL